jgi:hypothetical protein
MTMNITLDLPDAIAQQLSAKAAKDGLSVEEYVLCLAVREATVTAEHTPFYPLHFAPPEVWVRVHRQWAESHPRVDHFVDDSRESIYFGRDE